MVATAAASTALKIFISYSRKDIGIANDLADALEARGFDVLIDRRDLPYGEQWQIELGDLIRNADAVVWLVSQSSVLSRWCNWELGEVMRLNKRLVPIAIQDLTTNDMPEAIGKIQLLPHEGRFSMEKHLGTLQYVLETDMAWVKEHTRLADRARQWIAKRRHGDLLLRGAQLRDAQSWLDARRPTAPMPGTETLELLLASRRAATRRRSWWIASPVLAIMAILFSYALFMWAGTRTWPDTNIAMGDIVNADGDVGFDQSYLGCRLNCIFNRFGQTCVAFSYDRSVPPPVQLKQAAPGEPIPAPASRSLEISQRRCYPKFAVDFYWRPSTTGSEPFDTEIMPVLFGESRTPKTSPYLMRWNRTLSGEPVDVGDVLSRADDVTYFNDARTGRVSWSLRAGDCQQLCIDLGDRCKGFAISSFANRCELFKRVKGVLRDSNTTRPVFIHGSISACDDPESAIDPETKQSECPPRLDFRHAAPTVRSSTGVDVERNRP